MSREPRHPLGRQRSESSQETAKHIVVESISQFLDVPNDRIQMEDDIHADYRGPEPLAALTIDDRREGVLDTIKDRVEEQYPPWDPRECGPRVQDIIADLARHLAAVREQRTR